VIAKFQNIYDAVEIPLGSQDWSKHQRLSIKGNNMNPGDSVIGIRIDGTGPSERFDQRYNKKVVVSPGEFEVVIDISEIRDQVKSKRFSIKKIKRLILFKSEAGESTTVCIGKIMLSN
jgi:hypothetical protein